MMIVVPPRSTVLLLLAQAPGEADARAEVVLVGVDEVLGGPTSAAMRIRPRAMQPRRQQGRDLLVGDHVVAAVLGAEVARGRRSFSCHAPTIS